MSSLYLNIHNYVKIQLIDPPAGLRQRLTSEYPIFVQDSLSNQNTENNVQAIIRFVDDQILPLNHHNIYFGPQLGYADQEHGLFCYVDKYGAVCCLDLKQSSADTWFLIASTKVVPSNFVEIVIRGWILRYHLLQQQVSFIHASAVSWQKKGILFSAWGGTGKTNLVFKFLANGAAYMGDDLALVTSSGDLLAFPERVNIFDYNLKNFPALRSKVSTKNRILFGVKHSYESFYQKTNLYLSVNSGLRAILKRIKDLTYPLGAFPIDTKEIFPQRQICYQQQLSYVFHLFRSNDEHIHIEKVISKEHLAIQMAACLRYEHHYCDHLYDAFLFAFPEYANATIDHLFVHQQAVIRKAISNAVCWYVYVPANTSANQLFEAVDKILANHSVII